MHTIKQLLGEIATELKIMNDLEIQRLKEKDFSSEYLNKRIANSYREREERKTYI